MAPRRPARLGAAARTGCQTVFRYCFAECNEPWTMDDGDFGRMDIDKLTTGLSGAIGKTVTRVFLVKRRRGQFQLFLVFADGTNYELYGEGWISGARCVDREDDERIRARLSLDTAVLAEVPRVAP